MRPTQLTHAHTKWTCRWCATAHASTFQCRNVTRVCWRNDDVFQWTSHTRAPHSWDRIHAVGDGRVLGFYSSTTQLKMHWRRCWMLSPHATSSGLWIVFEREPFVWTGNAQQPHIIQHQSQNIVTSGESRRAATKISMKYHFVSVCIGRTKLQHRLRGHWSLTSLLYVAPLRRFWWWSTVNEIHGIFFPFRVHLWEGPFVNTAEKGTFCVRNNFEEIYNLKLCVR